MAGKDRATTNILVLEDDREQMRVYQRELSAEGYTVFTARNGKSAVNTAKQNPPDIVVLDINMHGMEGVRAAIRILEEHKRIPIIINTAYPRAKDNFMMWVTKAYDAYIIESADLSELKKIIKEILEKARSTGEGGRNSSEGPLRTSADEKGATES